MRFLIDACLPRGFKDLLIAHAQVATDVRDIGMGHADDVDVAAHARQGQFCLLTEDWGFADIRVYPPEDYCGIVVFETADMSIDGKLAILRTLLERNEIVQALPGRLAIVTKRKIRLRPPM